MQANDAWNFHHILVQSWVAFESSWGQGGTVWVPLTLFIGRQLVHQMGLGCWQSKGEGWLGKDGGRARAWWPVEFCHLSLCAFLFLHDPAPSPPLTPLTPPRPPPQSPAGRAQWLVMKGLSNGSFLYPSPTKLVWQLSPLPRPAFILSLSASEYILSEWISLQTPFVRVCV